MSTDDPSQVDSSTLLKSLSRDLDMYCAALREAQGWAQQARYTVFELTRRQEAPPEHEQQPVNTGKEGA